MIQRAQNIRRDRLVETPRRHERVSRAVGRGAGRTLWMPMTIALLACLLVATLIAIGAGSDSALAAAAAILPSLLIAGYLGVSREGEIFHPLTFLFLTVFFGVTVQTSYLLFMDDGGHRFAVGRMTDPQSLLVAIAAITLGIVALLVGFSIMRHAGPIRLKPERRWNGPRIRLVAMGLLAIGLVSLAYYVSVFDVMDNLREQFAVKRRLIDVDTGVSRTLGWVRFGVNFSQLAFFICYAAYLRSSGGKGMLRTLTIISGVAGFLMPFIASSRLGILTFMLGAAMIHHFSTGGWPLKRLRNVAIIGIVIILGMGALRYVQSRGITFTEYNADVSTSEMLEPVLGSSNFLAVGKTAVVLESVPSRIEYQYGKTYLLWLVAPIPRSMWPNKPIIRIGALLGEAIFGTTLRGGVPPGIVGELFFNFGWIGIPVGMMLYGVLMAWFYRRYGIPAYRNINKCVIYSSVLVFIGFTGLSADFTGMMSMMLQRVVPLAVILFLISDRRSRNPVRSGN